MDTEDEILKLIREVEAFIKDAESRMNESKKKAKEAVKDKGVIKTVTAQIVNADAKTIAKFSVLGLAAYALYDVATAGSSPKKSNAKRK